MQRISTISKTTKRRNWQHYFTCISTLTGVAGASPAAAGAAFFTVVAFFAPPFALARAAIIDDDWSTGLACVIPIFENFLMRILRLFRLNKLPTWLEFQNSKFLFQRA